MKDKNGMSSSSEQPSRRKFISIAAGVVLTATAVALLVAACGGSTKPEKADLILQNGAVYTVDKNRSAPKQSPSRMARLCMLARTAACPT
jgi:hypothetical protein